jgi:hypothetical protein
MWSFFIWKSIHIFNKILEIIKGMIMKITKKSVFIIAAISVLMGLTACSLIKNAAAALENIKRLQFKLENVNGFKVSGIKLSDKSSVSSFSVSDGLKLLGDFNSKRLPSEFTLNVAAKNPNDGTGGSEKTTATLSSLEWQLYIDDVPTIRGNIDNPIEIPGTGQQTIIPLRMSLDLWSFFKERGYDKVINLALAIGGVSGNAAKLKLDAKPTVTTPFGPVNYPGRITIIDKQFN